MAIPKMSRTPLEMPHPLFEWGMNLVTVIMRWFPTVSRQFFLSVFRTRELFRTRTTTEGMENIYTYRVKLNFSWGFMVNWFVLWALKNARGARNRLRMVAGIIEREIARKLADQAEVKVLSLAGGSTRAPIEAASQLDGGRIKIVCLDRDMLAIKRAQELAGQLGLDGAFLPVQGNVLRPKREWKNEIDVIEIVGLCDYLNQREVDWILRLAWGYLKPGGLLIMGNVRKNAETGYLDDVWLWPMVERTEIELEESLFEAGFQDVIISQEPLGIHLIGCGRKPAD